jgi:glycosyl transferase family 2
MTAQPKPTPIAMFGYNRPAHLQRALDSLARCRRLDECQVCIYIDGPKSDEGADAVEATRQVALNWTQAHGGTIIAQPENLGLARSIVFGVTTLCQQYGRVIVIEDDLIVSQDFLDYMLESLDHYQDEPRVYSVNGFTFPLETPPNKPTFLLPLTSTWGWATWDRAWKAFDWSMPGASEFLEDPENRKQFDLGGAYPYSKDLENRQRGRGHGWGIIWYYCVFREDGLCLFPRQSLVANLGLDGSGTHFGKSEKLGDYLASDLDTAPIENPLVFPATLDVDAVIFDQIRQAIGKIISINQAQNKSSSFITRVYLKVKYILLRQPHAGEMSEP